MLLNSVCNFFLFAIFLLTTGCASEAKQFWECNEDSYCKLKYENGSQKLFESQHDCRMSCGKYGSIWPLPTKACSLSHERVLLDPWKVRFNVVAPTFQLSQIVREMNRIFLTNALKECIRNCTAEGSKDVFIKVTVISKRVTLDWSTDESYSVDIRSTDIATFVDVKAGTIFGVRHGLETISHMMTGANRGGILMVASAHIEDAPIYAHRGLLLDCSRNYIPLKSIKSTLDAMATSKLNVFHWHVSDSHSFPLEIGRIPEMQRYGAYSKADIYTRTDVLNIVKYARIRGIRVIIEIDGPSHAGMGWQWGPMAGLGNLTVCFNQKPWRSFCSQPPCGQLNPLNENVYGLMKEIYEDIIEMNSPEETTHMGGDEVAIPCWNSTDEIVEKMTEMGYNRSLDSFLKLWSEFHNKNLNSWDEITQNSLSHSVVPKSVILWSSALTNPKTITKHLPKERFIIQTWVNSDDTLNTDLLSLGYRIIVSTKDAWYFDHGFWGNTQYHNWKTVYTNQLINDPKVLGGEVCLWSEYIDENNLDARAWPRAAAAAERLWSNPKLSTFSVEPRFYRHRTRLSTRGVSPEAVTPRWCTLHEGECL